MNKIYKVIWSKAKNCYVVASELAKNSSKSSNCSSKHKVMAATLFCVISLGLFVPYAEAAYNMTRTYITDDDFYAITDNPAVVGNDAGSIAIGQGATIRNSGSNAVAIGDFVYAHESSIAIGARYDAQDWHIDGMGDRFYGTTAEGVNDIVLGPASHATGNGTIIMGSSIISSASNAVIIGQGANASANNSLALGASSIADSPNTVSFGNGSLKRKLVNIAAGTSANDAAALSQVQTVTAGTNVRLNTTTNANGSKNQQVIVEGNGTVTSGNAGLIKGDTLYSEVRPSDGSYIRKVNTTAANLTALDSQLKTTGTRLSNEITNRINAIDMEKSSREFSDEVLSTRIGTLNHNGNYIVAANNVSQNIDILDNKIGSAESADGNFTRGFNTVNENIGVLDAQLKALGDSLEYTDTEIQEKLNKKANVDASNVTDAQAWANKIGTGSVSPTDTELVTGASVAEETRVGANGSYVLVSNTAGQNISALDLQVKKNTDDIANLQQSTSDALDTKANVTLDNISMEGETVIRNLAKGAVKVVAGVSTTVTQETEGEAIKYAVNVIKDGVVEEGNDGVVTGGTVNNAIKNVMTHTQNELLTKANVDASNVSSYAEEWGSAIGTGLIVTSDNKLITGDTIYNEVRPVDGNYILKNNSTAQNLNSLDTQLKALGDSLENISAGTRDGLDTKANVTMDNLADEGKEVIRELAKGSVKVINGTNTTVTSGSDGDAKVYAVHVVTDGIIEDGNMGIVTGGTVKEAIDSLLNVTDNRLLEYAKKDASNVDAQVWGEKLGSGTVNATDTKLVSGKTVFSETRIAEDGNYIRKNNSASQNLFELDRIVKETREVAENAVLHSNDDNAVHYDTADKSVITLAGTDGTVITNLKNGELSENSKDAVTGNQLFNTNKNVKANTDSIQSIIDSLGTIEDGNYVSKDKMFGENMGALDTQLKSVSDGLDTVRTDVNTLRNTLTETANGKADTDLGNITEDGKTVIANIAKGSVKVTGSGIATVTTLEEGQTTTYNVDVQANGVIEEGNTNAVSGGTVYNTVQALRNDINMGLDGKANTDLSNLTDAGKQIIRDSLQGDLDKKANVDASNIDVNSWAEKLGTGVIEEGNIGLINGDTAYQAIHELQEREVVKADFENGVIRIANEPKYDAIDTIDVSKSDGSLRVITGVATNPQDKTSVANVGYVDSVGSAIMNQVHTGMSRLETKTEKVGANAAAMSALMPAPMDGDEKWSFSASVGNYRSETAAAVGAFFKPQDNVIVNVRGSIGNEENMVGAGVSVALNRGNTPRVSKAQLVRTINAQAEKIQAQDSQIAAQAQHMQAQDAKIQSQANEIAELRAMMTELAAKVK